MEDQIKFLLERAVQNLQGGNLQDAKFDLLKILENTPNNFDALNLLGFIYGLEGNHLGAKNNLKNALLIMPGHEVASINLIKSLYELGEFNEALSLLKDIGDVLQNDPALPFIHANCLVGLGLISESVPYFYRALDLGGGLEAHMDLAYVLACLKRYDEALIHYEKALQISPEYAEAWSNTGVILYNLKRYDEALIHYEKALQISPEYAEAWNNKGMTLLALRRHQEALSTSKNAISLKSNYAEAWFSAGNSLLEMGSYVEAIVYFDEAIKLHQEYAEAWSNKGCALKALRRFDLALDSFETAIKNKPLFADALFNKGVLLSELGRGNESIEYFEKALTINNDLPFAQGELLNTKMKNCLWKDFDKNLQKIIDGLKNDEKVIAPLHLFSLIDDAQLQKKCAEIFNQFHYPSDSTLGPFKKGNPNQKISIGYFSSDFRTHPVSLLTSELFELHDRNKFKVFAFSLQKTPKLDKVSERLRSTFDVFLDVDGLSDLEIAKLSRDQGIDIAIDLNGYTDGSRTRIFSYRAAPVQVNYLGYPGTTGAEYMDYIISDKTVIPVEMANNYVEKIIHLPNSFMPVDSGEILTQEKASKKSFGLPETGFIFSCFNGGFKLNELVLRSWAKILLAVDSSILWIASSNITFKKNILVEFGKLGVDSSRIIFAERVGSIEDHLSRISLSDLFLDTNPYNAHSTAIDFLKAGVPIIAIPGNSFPSRVSASILYAIGLPELIMKNQAEYELKAIELAKNPTLLTNIKEKLAKNRKCAPLFNTRLYTKNLEQAYIKIMNRFGSDQRPDHLFL
jgi:predicted O-linked N-acetylglucosamine transferase (SPINDLY family)